MSFIEIEKSVEKARWAMPDLHSHPHYELYFLEKGERNFYIGSTLYIVKENTAVLVRPYLMHKTEGGPFSRINVDFSDDILNDKEKEILLELAKTVVFPLKTENGIAIKEMLRTMLSVWKKPNKLDKTAVTLCVKSLIGSLYLFRPTVGDVEKLSVNDSTRPQTLKIIRYINEHYSQKLTIALLAEEFCLSESCLSKTFKRETGYNVGEFILNVRINEAKKLLSSTKLSVNKIAEKLGFSSANYFGLIFKQKVGISPLMYKRWLDH